MNKSPIPSEFISCRCGGLIYREVNSFAGLFTHQHSERSEVALGQRYPFRKCLLVSGNKIIVAVDGYSGNFEFGVGYRQSYEIDRGGASCNSM